MTDLSQLIERLEKAHRPDRELDQAIAEYAIGEGIKGVHGNTYTREPMGIEYYQDDGERFTASIDAALTLVPEGRALERRYLPKAHWPCRLWLFSDSSMPGLEEHRPMIGGNANSRCIAVLAKTEPIGLCIAALRARQGEHGS